jgi:type I restriction enzyme S subunit
MKPSGIEWIGDIPAEWETKKLRYAAKLRTESGTFSDGDIYIGLENIESSTGKYIQTETEYNEGMYDIVKEGDVLFGKLRPYLEKVYISKINGFCTGEFLNFKEFGGDKLYLYYFLFSHGFIEVVNSSTYGAKMPRAEWDFIKNLKIPTPPSKEQQAIAAFLDTQCTSIDGIISKMEQQVEILKQYKTSLITETVTKGLNKDVPMKDSGIEWIGEIPAHWEVGKIKYTASFIGSGTTPDSSNSEYYDGELNWIQSGDLYQTDLINTTERKITQKAVKEIPALRLYKKKFLVIAMYGASIGNTAISNIDAYVNQACCCIIPNSKNNMEYLYYFIQSSKYDLLLQSVGGGQPNISQIIIKNRYCLLPPLNEQKAIASFLNVQNDKIKNIITQKRQSIDTMRAYKRSLIYEYVTGKKRVV